MRYYPDGYDVASWTKKQGDTHSPGQSQESRLSEGVSISHRHLHSRGLGAGVSLARVLERVGACC